MTADENKVSRKQPWSQSFTVLVLAILAAGPLAIPLIWINHRLSVVLKVIITLAVLGITYALLAMTERVYQQASERLSVLKELLS